MTDATWLPTLLVLALLGCAVAAYHYDWGPRYLGWYGDDPTRDPAAVAPPAGLEFPEWQEPAPVADPVTPLGRADIAAVESALAQGLKDKTLGKHVVAAVGDLVATARCGPTTTTSSSLPRSPSC